MKTRFLIALSFLLAMTGYAGTLYPSVDSTTYKFNATNVANALWDTWAFTNRAYLFWGSGSGSSVTAGVTNQWKDDATNAARGMIATSNLVNQAQLNATSNALAALVTNVVVTNGSFTGTFAGTFTGDGASLTNIVDQFTVIQFGDQQNQSRYLHPGFTNAVNWVISNRAALNIRAVVFPGDLTDLDSQAEYDYMTNQLIRMRSVGIAIIATSGNHDNLEGNHTNMPNVLTNQPAYAESYNPEYVQTAVFLQTNSNSKTAFLTMQNAAGDTSAITAWCSNMCVKYADYSVIAVTHSFVRSGGYLDTNGWAYYGKGDLAWTNWMYQAPNLLAVMCGHDDGNTTTDYEKTTSRMTLVGQRGNVVNGFHFDPQQLGTQGSDAARYLRLYQFHPTQNRVHARTFDFTANDYVRSQSSDFEFSIKSTSPQFLLTGLVPSRAYGPTWYELGKSNVTYLWSSNSTGDAIPTLYQSYFDASSNRVDTNFSVGTVQAGAITNNQSGVTLSGTFSGDGSGLTNLIGISATNGSFSGSFSGDGSGLTNLNAASLTGVTPSSVLATNAGSDDQVLTKSGENAKWTTVNSSGWTREIIIGDYTGTFSSASTFYFNPSGHSTANIGASYYASPGPTVGYYSNLQCFCIAGGGAGLPLATTNITFAIYTNTFASATSGSGSLSSSLSAVISTAQFTNSGTASCPLQSGSYALMGITLNTGSLPSRTHGWSIEWWHPIP